MASIDHALDGRRALVDDAQRRCIAEHGSTSLTGRLIEPEEIAAMVVYLSSDAASATTGGALRVDGGFVDNIVL